MKKIFLVMLLAGLCGLSFGQVIKPLQKKIIPLPTLKTLTDSASYAIGVSVASFYKQQGAGKINPDLVAKAMKDVLAGKKMLLNESKCNDVMQRYITNVHQQKSKSNIDSGEAFLKKNKLRPTVKTTATGLQYEMIRDGNGFRPYELDSVTCNYKGYLVNGTVFDDSYIRGQPITFSLRNVIAGWTEGLQLMSVGSKYKLFVPYQLGYGAFDHGSIPGGSVLIFEIELLNVIKTVMASH